jgi:hypothetical protein
MKGEGLMVVQETADDFRAAVSALRSLDASKGVSFHTFSLPEDRCARLLIKNLGRRMPEDVVREELGALGICIQEVMQLRSGRRNENPEQDRPMTPHFIVTVARGPEVSKLRPITKSVGSEWRWKRTRPRKAPCSASAASASATPSVTAVTRLVVWRVG